MATTVRRIVAIGGGEIGRPKEDGIGYYPVETTPIDKEILRSTMNKRATLLFIPTASNDSQAYFNLVKKHFSKIGFASVDVLYLLDKSLTKARIRKAILSYDAIYVGGGNTLKMMMIWRKLGVDTMLKQALNRGIVLSGISAGSICWFSKGSSDSRRFTSDSTGLINVTGLGFIDAILCPHFDVEPHRRSDIKKKMMGSSKVAICLDNGVALEVVSNEYRIIKSKSTAKAYKAYWKSSKYYLDEIKNNDSLMSIDSLLEK